MCVFVVVVVIDVIMFSLEVYKCLWQNLDIHYRNSNTNKSNTHDDDDDRHQEAHQANAVPQSHNNVEAISQIYSQVSRCLVDWICVWKSRADDATTMRKKKCIQEAYYATLRFYLQFRVWKFHLKNTDMNDVRTKNIS